MASMRERRWLRAETARPRGGRRDFRGKRRVRWNSITAGEKKTAVAAQLRFLS